MFCFLMIFASSPDFSGRFLRTNLACDANLGVQAGELFCVRSYKKQCFAHLEKDSVFWMDFFLKGSGKLPKSETNKITSTDFEGKGKQYVFGVGDFGFTNDEVTTVCNGSGYPYEFIEEENTWKIVHQGEQYLELTGAEFIDIKEKRSVLCKVRSVSFADEVTKDDLGKYSELLACSILPSLVEVDVSHCPDGNGLKLLEALTYNTTLRNLRTIRASNLNVDDALLERFGKMFFCLPLIRDGQQQNPRNGMPVATIRIDAKTNQNKMSEINNKLQQSFFNIWYLNNSKQDQAVIRLTT